MFMNPRKAWIHGLKLNHRRIHHGHDEHEDGDRYHSDPDDHHHSHHGDHHHDLTPRKGLDTWM